MICILLFGLCGSGKSTFCSRANSQFGLQTIQLRRLFESIAGVENAKSLYNQLLSNTGSRTAWLDYMSDEIKSEIKSNDITVIEGLFTQDEVEWFESFTTVYVIYLEVKDFGKRLVRYSVRESYPDDYARIRLSESDDGRKAAGVEHAKDFADFVICNDGAIDDFYKAVDSVLDQIVTYPCLSELCHYTNKEESARFTPIDVVYYIRHVSIADGCKNACSHCFSNSPSQITQTSLSGFRKIISEIGSVVAKTGHPLSFFHLGASTDPCSVEHYSDYLHVWRSAFPSFQTIKVFTHGWNLSDSEQEKEMTATLEVAKQYKNIKFVISFDEFSIGARTNWERYLKNISLNVIKIIDAIGKDRIRVEVFYNISRNTCDSQFTLQHWREAAEKNVCPSLNEILDVCSTAEKATDRSCAKITSGLCSVFLDAGLCSTDLFDMSRDCQTIFNAGRARQFYKKEDNESIQIGLDIQKQHVLYSLDNYDHGYKGVIIYPGGQAQIVNYHGFNLLQHLNNGKKVISCMSSSKFYDYNASKYIRSQILTMSYNSQVAHIPSAFSMCDYLGVLFESLVSPYTYRFVLGKPFGAQSYYALFSYYGWISQDLSKYGSLDPEWRYIIQRFHPHITYIDESMGNCLSVANGIALTGRNVFVNISDAAFQEGTIWESILFAGSHHLSTLIMAIDNNNMQALGPISSILDLGSLENKIEAFGWEVYSCNGHNIDALHTLVANLQSKVHDKPVALVMHTEKGHGVSFIENNSSWHYKILDESNYNKAIEELR